MAADSSRGGSSAPTSTMLNDGTVVKVNDHVYLAPEHLGECYYIGRIMEFANQPQKKGLMARIAWFYRPKDVLTRRNIDPYLLLATMHSDLNPVSSIRGRCYVTHKYYIPEKDMDAYKAAGDHFYYNQLFDKFTLRVYDVIPCETVRNVPKEIAKAMNEKFQFIVVEQQRAVELTSEQKVCVVCSQWCAIYNSVKCSACKNNYHMECLNPPLMRKPSKGFAWECAWCTKKAAKLSPEELKQLSVEEQKQLLELDSPPPTPQTPNTPSHTTSTYSTNEHKPISPSFPVFTSSSSSKSRSTPASRSATPSQSDIPKDDFSPRKVLTRGQESEKKIKSSEKQFPMTKMWPFRYFGIHTNIQDIFDSEDRLNPRANSSIGPKHQAVVPDWSENGPAYNGELYTNMVPSDKSAQGNRHGRNRRADKRGPRKHRIPAQDENTGESSMNIFANGMPKRKSNGYLDEEPSVTSRGTSDTITIIFNRREKDFTDEQCDAYMDAVKNLPSLPVSPQSSDLMDRALLELEHSNYNVDKALKKMSVLTKEDLDIGHWTPEEIANFEKGIKAYGHDIFSVSKSVPSKKMKDIVRFFYKWKKTPRYEPVYTEWTTIYKPGKKFRNRGLETSSKTPTAEDSEASEDEEGEDDADPTVVPPKGAPPEGYQCTNCGTMDSAIWRRSPGDTERRRRKFLKVLCDRCGVYWLKYGVMRVVTEAELKRRGRKPRMEGTSKEEGKFAAKRKRMFNDPNAKFPRKVKDSSRDRGRERSLSPFPPTACTVCLHMDPSDALLTCRDCGMSVHKGCYGELDHDLQWRCDICNNNKNPTASTTYQCVLCSKPATDARQALKRTSGNNWAHVLCSIYIPEIRFTHAKELQVVEGIGNINSMRWNQVCAICQVPNKGACISGCDFCKIPVHVTCAQDAYYKVGFEMQTVKASRNVFNVPSTCFKTGGGFMVPQIWCPKHDLTNARVVDLTEINKDTLEPALMTYATTYKQSDQSSAGAMRKSRLVSSAATNVTNPANTSRRRSSLTPTVNRKSAIGKAMSHPPPQCKCVNCGVCVSPIWWDLPEKPKDEEEDQKSELVASITGFNGSVINGHGKTNGIKAEEGAEIDIDVMTNSARSFSQDRDSEAPEELVQKKLCQKCYWGKGKENGSVLSFGNGSSLV